jgi:hypothetical protein
MTAPSPGFLRGVGGLSWRAWIWGGGVGQGHGLDWCGDPLGHRWKGMVGGGKVSSSVGVSALGFEALLQRFECRQGCVME